MPPHTLPRSAPALFSHVTADNAPLYRAILDVFAASKRQFRLHLRPDDVLAEATWPGGPPTPETVQQALGQLVHWGNLQSQPDTARVATIEDFYRKRLLYRMTSGGEAVEAGLQAFVEALARRAELQSVALAASYLGCGVSINRALPASKVSSINTMTTVLEVNRLYAAWRRLGVNFSVTSCTEMVEVEPLILATAAVAGADERLTICAISWLARYHSFVDGRRLSELTRDSAATVRSYLGIMLSLAIEAPDGAGRAPQYEAALAHCKPLRRSRALYDNIEALPAFREWARTHGLPVYRRWGFWHDDVTLKLVSIHPLARILKVPELRARALCGPSIEAAFIAHATDRVTNARSLSRDIGVSYAAAHAAVERLVGRGLLLRHRNGVRQELSPSAFAVNALKVES